MTCRPEALRTTSDVMHRLGIANIRAGKLAKGTAFLREGERLRVLAAHARDGHLPAWRKWMDAVPRVSPYGIAAVLKRC